MKRSPLCIFVDRLSNGEVEEIEETIDATLLEIGDKDLALTGSVLISGEAYVADDNLILDLNLTATAKKTCSICNEPTEFPIEIDDLSLVIEHREISSGVFNYTDEIRSAILLKAPDFIECGEGNCNHREEIKKFLKGSSPDTYSPFSDL